MVTLSASQTKSFPNAWFEELTRARRFFEPQPFNFQQLQLQIQRDQHFGA
jgi:hypothetical protein